MGFNFFLFLKNLQGLEYPRGNEKNNNLKTATFAAGCFWGVEEIFRKIKGVKSTVVGYTGGNFENPNYKDVCTGKTGHAEAVKVRYDPKEVSYEELLNAFWENHNPTTLNRQGLDIGAQYRSAIFFYGTKQEELAKKLKENLEKSGKFKHKIVTEVTPETAFYEAEEYHQKYLQKKGQKIC